MKIYWSIWSTGIGIYQSDICQSIPSIPIIMIATFGILLSFQSFSHTYQRSILMVNIIPDCTREKDVIYPQGIGFMIEYLEYIILVYENKNKNIPYISNNHFWYRSYTCCMVWWSLDEYFIDWMMVRWGYSAWCSFAYSSIIWYISWKWFLRAALYSEKSNLTMA